MYRFEDIKKVHVEITNKCQAMCPMCPRNIHGGIKNPLVDNNKRDWTLEDFTYIFTADFLNQLHEIQFCGSFGDPILNNNLIDMCLHIKKHNSAIRVSINTNGSARNAEFWKQLALAMPDKHAIFFDLDGIDQKTHKLYRINTDLDTILNNAKIVIDNGAKAHWHFIRFKHNQDQVEQCRQKANELGFAEFVLKDSRRFAQEKFPVLDNNGKISYYLEQPTTINIPIADVSTIKDYKSWSNCSKIHCHSQVNREIYIDVDKLLFPCCIIPAFLYTNYDNNLFRQYNLDLDTYNEIGAEIKQDVFKLIESLGGRENIDLSVHGVKSVIETDTWQTMWKDKWENNESMCCTAMCSADSPFIKIHDQFTERK